MGDTTPIGQRMVEFGLIDQDTLEQCLEEQEVSGVNVESLLIEKGLISHDDLTRALARQFRVPAVDLDKVTIEETVLKLVPEDVVRKYQVLPVRRKERILTVAMVDPTNIPTIDDLRFITRCKIEPVVASAGAIAEAIDSHYGTMRNEPPSTDEPFEIMEVEPDQLEEEEDAIPTQDMADGAPVVKLVNAMLTDAVRKKATHIHIESGEEGLLVRYRVDGILQDVMRPPMKLKAALSSRLKILSNLNIAERRIPQEGRLSLKIGKRIYDIKVFSLPVIYGERFSLELTEKSGRPRDIDHLGLLPEDSERLKHHLMDPSGLVLITGPRRSGKKTTLYSAMDHLRSEEIAILSAEKFIGRQVEGVSQSLVRDEIDLSYDTVLTGLIQQDPDILVVQDIEDLAVAIAILQGSLDGFKFLASLRSLDASSGLLKLLELGVQPSLLASAVSCVFAQRLVRRICPGCTTKTSPAKGQVEEVARLTGSSAWTSRITDPHLSFVSGAGCDQCGGTGYRGRIPVCEILEVTPDIRDTISRDSSWESLRAVAISGGMQTMMDNALARAAAGETSLRECVRISQRIG